MDFLYKVQEPALKQMAKNLTEELAYDCEPLQYLLIDGRFRGATVGHFRYGPYDLNDIVCDLPDAESRRDEILQAVMDVNPGGQPKRFMGKDLLQISVLNQKCTSGYPRIPSGVRSYTGPQQSYIICIFT